MSASIDVARPARAAVTDEQPTRGTAPAPPIRVLMDMTLPRHIGGGTATYGFGLLAALRQRPEVRLRTVSADRIARRPRSRARRVARALHEALWLQTALPLHARASDVDILHAPSFLAPVLPPRPLILTIMDTIYLRFPEHYPALWLRYFTTVVAAAARRARAIVTISHASAREIAHWYGIGPERVRVIYPGVDPLFGRPLDRAALAGARERYGLTRPFVFCIGTLSTRKNVPRLVEAFGALKQRGLIPEHQLALAGSASPGMPGYAELLATVDRLGLREQVRFLGEVPHRETPALYHLADLMAMPSLYEGFGFPVAEAMACGTPVVASNVSSLPEVAGEAALLFDPHDTAAIAEALHRALTDEPLRRELIARGRAQAARFTWARTAEETVALYRDVLRDAP